MTSRKVALALAAVAVFAATAVAQVPTGIPQFSGDMKMSGRGGELMNGKIYFGGSKIRFDMNGRGHEMIMLHDIGTKTSYMIMPQQKMYMEINANGMGGRGPRMPDAKPLDPKNPCANDTDYTCKNEGTETVNGRSCDKWLFTKKSDPQDTRTVWIDQKLHFPIKSVGSAGDTWEMTNVQEGPQPASLFEVPSGYTKMDMGGMMGGRAPHP